MLPVVVHTVTVEFANAVPVSVTESLELTAPLVMTGAGRRAAATATVTPSGLELTLLPAAVVSLAVKAYAPADKFAVVKLQAPVLFAVVVPSLVPVVLHTVTVEFANAVPVRVKESLELTAILLMAGAATPVLVDTVAEIETDGALVPPAAVLSMAVNP